MKDRKNILVIVFIFVIVGVIGSTFAYYKINHAPVENIFSASLFDTSYEMDITSDLCMDSSKNKKEDYNFSIKNTSNKEFMVRVSLEEAWTDNSGNVVSSNIVNSEKLAIIKFVNQEDWKKIGNYYYYKYSIEAGEETSNLIEGIEITKYYDGTNMCHYDTNTNVGTCQESTFLCEDYLFKGKIKLDVMQTDDYEEVWNVSDETVKQNSTYTVNFIPNGTDITGSMQSEDFVYGERKTLTENAYSKEGYDFIEWNTNYLGTGTSYKDKEAVLDIGNGDTDIVNLYAIWKKPYDVVFFSNDSVNCPLDSTVYAKIENVKYGSLIKEEAIPNPECTEFIFNGWVAEGDINRETAKYGVINAPTNNWVAGNKGTYFKNLSSTGGEVELIAEWEARTYMIHFDGNGVSGGDPIEPIECAYNEECTLPVNTFVRKGYDFKGWSTTSNGSVEYDDEEGVTGLTLNDEITLYAVWELNVGICPRNFDIEVAPGVVCKRAEELHEVSCNQTTQGCKNVTGSQTTIVYGNCGIDEETYTQGDAFDCDVNGDGEFNERFYYVSDYYNPNTNKWDSNTAVLVYYTSVKKVDGKIVPDVDTGNKYYSSDSNASGPAKGDGYAMSQLPTTTDWSNVSLINTTRQIRNRTGGTTASGNNLSSINYTGFAARFLTVQELESACGINAEEQASGGLDSCTYIMENTRFQDTTYLMGIWLETARGSSDKQNYRTLGGSRKTGVSTVSNTGKEYGSTRPVIELAKSKISLEMQDTSNDYTVTFNANGGTGSMDVQTCETFVKCTLNSNTYSKEGYIFVGWSTTPNGHIEYENKEEVYNIILSGNIDLYAVWDDDLYSVVKECFDKTHVDKYVGHGAGNFEKAAYYYKGSSSVNNVIYGNYCWKIIRTTETGGVKLLYNGEVENGKCLSTRSDKTGVLGLSPEVKDLNGNYLYGTEFELAGNTFTVTGTTKTGTYTENTASNYQGLYTCLNTTGSCSKIYRVGANSSGTLSYTAVYTTGQIGYNEIATSDFNSNYKSVSSIGYMYNTSYNYTTSGNCYYETTTGDKRCLNVSSLSDALNTMIRANDVNTYDSDVKSLIDIWYASNMQEVSSGIEDTVYCNVREPYNSTTIGSLTKSGWHGGKSNQPLYFYTSKTSGQNSNFMCEYSLDKFTTSSSNGNGALDYPVGLLTYDEYRLLYYNSSSPIGTVKNGMHLMSANNVSLTIDNNYVKSDLSTDYGSTGNIRGVRPVISLNPGTKYSIGTGTESDPYIVALIDPNKSTLVIDLNGGTSTQKIVISANNGEEITLVTPTKEDYTFINWTVEKGTPSSFSGNKITLDGENVVIKANWKIDYDNKYSVNFASSDNNCPLDSTTYASISNVSYGQLIKSSAIPNPVCEGYKFTGWTLTGDKNVTTAKYGTVNTPSTLWEDNNKGTYFKNLSTTDNGVVTLTANWAKINKIELQTTSGNSTYLYETSDGWCQDETCTISVTSITPPTKTGYTFGGYYTEENGSGVQVIDADGTINNNVSSLFSQDEVLYPKWIANTYTIVFDGNGSTGGSTESKTCTYDEDCVLTSNGFTKTEYNFTGWATSSSGSKVYDNVATVKNLTTSGTYRLYAKWIKNSATFVDGKSFNSKLTLVSGVTKVYANDDVNSIRSIKWASSLPNNFTASSDDIVSTNESGMPIYVWYDSSTKTVYFYTEASEIHLNSDSSFMFSYFSSLNDISFLSSVDTSSVTNMIQMFYRCSSLTDISALSKWDTSNVTDMRLMFVFCSNLTDISALSKWNTSSVTDMGNMFNNCSSLTDISSLSNWNTSGVTNMTQMFFYCSSLTDISGLQNWDTSGVTNMSKMFCNCSSLTDISSLLNWNTSSVTDMSYLFRNCSSLTDISGLQNWDTSSVTDMSLMFCFCSSLTDISSLSNWDTSNTTNVYGMFWGCRKIQGTFTINGNPTTYDSMFDGAATSGSGVIVNYSSSTTNIDAIINTKSSGSNVTKGVQID